MCEYFKKVESKDKKKRLHREKIPFSVSDLRWFGFWFEKPWNTTVVGKWDGVIIHFCARDRERRKERRQNCLFPADPVVVTLSWTYPWHGIRKSKKVKRSVSGRTFGKRTKWNFNSSNCSSSSSRQTMAITRTRNLTTATHQTAISQSRRRSIQRAEKVARTTTRHRLTTWTNTRQS